MVVSSWKVASVCVVARRYQLRRVQCCRTSAVLSQTQVLTGVDKDPRELEPGCRHLELPVVYNVFQVVPRAQLATCGRTCISSYSLRASCGGTATAPAGSARRPCPARELDRDAII